MKIILKRKIIEPCCGKGAFLVGLYKIYLNKGIKNRFINEVSWNDINPANVQFCNLLFNTNKGTCQDALQLSYSQYDLVITNPPYSKERQDTKSGKIQLYNKFILQCSSKYQMMITPSRWLWQDSQKKLKELIKKKCIYLNVIQNPFANEANLQDVSYQILYQYNQTDYIFIDKQFQQKNQRSFLAKSYFGIGKNDILNQGKYQVKISQPQQKEIGQPFGYIDSYNQKQNYWKVLLPSMSGKPHSGLSSTQVHISPPEQLFSESYCAIICNDESDAVNVREYIISDEGQEELKQRESATINKTVLKLMSIPDSR